MLQHHLEKVSERMTQIMFKTFDASTRMQKQQQNLAKTWERRIKSMYKEQFGHTIDEEVVEEDGIEFTLTRNHLHRALLLSKPLGEIGS